MAPTTKRLGFLKEPPKKLSKEEAKLTVKQDRFANEVVKQIAQKGYTNLTEAAKKTYEVTTEDSARVTGSSNIAKINIQEAIRKGLKKAGVDFSDTIENVSNIATTKPDKVTASDVIRAAEFQAKVFGAYPDKKHLHVGLQFNTRVKDLSHKEATEQLKEIRSLTDGLVSDSD